MIRNQAKELLPIIKAFSEGKVIQSRHIKGGASLWYDVETPNFDNNDFDYRIKPEPKYRPFKDAEECWQEMLKHLPFGWVKRFGNYTEIITLDNNTITLSNSIGKVSFLSYKDYKQITFADGTPFGILEEE